MAGFSYTTSRDTIRGAFGSPLPAPSVLRPGPLWRWVGYSKTGPAAPPGSTGRCGCVTRRFDQPACLSAPPTFQPAGTAPAEDATHRGNAASRDCSAGYAGHAPAWRRPGPVGHFHTAARRFRSGWLMRCYFVRPLFARQQPNKATRRRRTPG
ncbi:hypothetical protein D3C85_1113460 [compost metagenome]